MLVPSTKANATFASRARVSAVEASTARAKLERSWQEGYEKEEGAAKPVSNFHLVGIRIPLPYTCTFVTLWTKTITRYPKPQPLPQTHQVPDIDPIL